MFPELLDNRNMKVKRLLSLRSSFQETSLVPISVRDWSDPRAIVGSEEINQWKISKIPLGFEGATSRLAVSQPTAPPRAFV